MKTTKTTLVYSCSYFKSSFYTFHFFISLQTNSAKCTFVFLCWAASIFLQHACTSFLSHTHSFLPHARTHILSLVPPSHMHAHMIQCYCRNRVFSSFAFAESFCDTYLLFFLWIFKKKKKNQNDSSMRLRISPWDAQWKISWCTLVNLCSCRNSVLNWVQDSDRPDNHFVLFTVPDHS